MPTTHPTKSSRTSAREDKKVWAFHDGDGDNGNNGDGDARLMRAPIKITRRLADAG